MGDKAEILWPNGMFVDQRVEYGERVVVIYRMPNFYVEVKFDLNSSGIKEIIALETEKHFDGYLNSISLFQMLY
ncbi:MAG: hypothetical protein V4635_09510 [Bacteroidota bacterium]